MFDGEDGLPRWCSGKESPCSARDTRDVGPIPVSERPLGGWNGSPLLYSLPGEWTENPAGCSPWGHTQWNTIQCLKNSNKVGDRELFSACIMHRCWDVFWNSVQSPVCIKLVQQCVHQTSSSDVHVHQRVTVTVGGLFFPPSQGTGCWRKENYRCETKTSLSGLRQFFKKSIFLSPF